MFSNVTIFHNPNCNSSVHAVRIAEELGANADVVVYRKTPPDAETLGWLIDHLEDPIADLVRKDAQFTKLGLRSEDFVTKEAVVELLVQQKMLLQRPVVVKGDRVIIGRPKERITDLLSS
jgi:arsenate reductase (glutaredoxin)